MCCRGDTEQFIHLKLVLITQGCRGVCAWTLCNQVFTKRGQCLLFTNSKFQCKHIGVVCGKHQNGCKMREKTGRKGLC
jgi:hypothetical protein